MRRASSAIAVGAVLSGSVAGGVAFGGEIHIADTLVRSLTDEYAWGFWAGVKQPLGAFQRGLNIHQITKSNYPIELVKGNPDYIFWVDEISGQKGISERPTGDFDGNTENPGGMVVFDEEGTVWYTFGGRASNLPLDLFRGDTPYDVTSFTKVLDNYETYAASTTPCLHVRDGKVVLVWRHGWSSSPDTTVRVRRYDIAQGFDDYEMQMDVGQGARTPKWLWGDVGIEQLYTRYDPRHESLFVTWQWFDYPFGMGSNPFVQSADFGDTWTYANGLELIDAPLDFEERNAVIVPYDHLRWGFTTDWVVADIGLTPNGTPWMTTPYGPQSNWRAVFWRFDGAEWVRHQLMTQMLLQAKPHACGATRDHMVFAYSEMAEPNILKVRVSTDDGVTWTDPIVLAEVPPEDTISWVSFVQPNEGYFDNRARFFYGHFRTGNGISAQRYQNQIKWVGFRVHQGNLPGDVNGDGVVDFADLVQILSVWGECPDCPEDLDENGVVNFADIILLLSYWG